jgi:hypothetical protein
MNKVLKIRLGASKTRRLLFYKAEAEWRENRLKAERAWLLDRRARRARPETEQALPRWGKACVFSSHSAGAFKRFSKHPA